MLALYRHLIDTALCSLVHLIHPLLTSVLHCTAVLKRSALLMAAHSHTAETACVRCLLPVLLSPLSIAYRSFPVPLMAYTFTCCQLSLLSHLSLLHTAASSVASLECSRQHGLLCDVLSHLPYFSLSNAARAAIDTLLPLSENTITCSSPPQCTH